MTGEAEAAIKLWRSSLSLDIAHERWTAVVVDLLNLGVAHFKTRPALASLHCRLCLEMARAIGDEDRETAALAGLAVQACRLGQHQEAEHLFDMVAARPVPPRQILEPGDLDFWRCVLAFDCGALSWRQWENARDAARRGRSRGVERSLVELGAALALETADADRALLLADEAIAMCRKDGLPIAPRLVLLAAALLAKGRRDEARARIDEALASQAGGRVSVIGAKVYHGLDQRGLALQHARRGYEWAWADGPPYVFWRPLQRLKRLYRELGEPEPVLSPFHPSRVGVVPFEKVIKAAIERLNAEKTARSREKAPETPPDQPA